MVVMMIMMVVIMLMIRMEVEKVDESNNIDYYGDDGDDNDYINHYINTKKTYHSMLLPTCTEVTKMVLEEVPIPLQKRTFSTG